MNKYFDIVHTNNGFHAVSVGVKTITRRNISRNIPSQYYHGFFYSTEEALRQNTEGLEVRHWINGEIRKWR